MSADSSRQVGAAGRDPSPDPTYYAKVRHLRGELARAWAQNHRPDVDCVRPGAHWLYHTEPDATGRRRCEVCHPLPNPPGRSGDAA